MSFCQTFTSVASPFAPFVLNMHSVDEIVISPSFNSHTVACAEKCEEFLNHFFYYISEIRLDWH